MNELTFQELNPILEDMLMELGFTKTVLDGPLVGRRTAYGPLREVGPICGVGQYGFAAQGPADTKTRLVCLLGGYRLWYEMRQKWPADPYPRWDDGATRVLPISEYRYEELEGEPIYFRGHEPVVRVVEGEWRDDGSWS